MLCVLFFCVFLWKKERIHCKRKGAWEFLGSFFSHRAHRVNRAFLRTFQAHRTPSAYREHRGLSTNISCNALCYRLTWCLCEPLCVLFFCVFLWEIEHTHSMRWHTNNTLGSFSLTELTDLTEHFNQRFELTEGLRHTEFTERYS